MGPNCPRKKGTPTPPIFGPCLLLPNGWMDQDATWYRSKRRPRRRCVRWGRSSHIKGAQPPVFGSYPFCPNGWMDEDATWYGSRPLPRPHCIRRGPSFPRKGHNSPLSSAHAYCGHGRPSQLLLSPCFITLSVSFVSVWQNKLAIRQLLGARIYSLSCHIVS